MEKEFIPYELALELKELGFDESCFGIWIERGNKHDVIYVAKQEDAWMAEQNDGILAPLYQQAFRWFREVHNLRGFIGYRPNVKKFDYHIYDMGLSGKEYVTQRTMEAFNKDPLVGTYEEAELGCLKQLIQIIKNK